MPVFDRRTASILATLVGFAVVLTIIYIARTVLIVFAFSILFAYLINPVVRFLQRHSLFFKDLRGPHVPEAYLACLLVLTLIGHGLAPQFQRAFGGLSARLPGISEQLSSGELANDVRDRLGWTEEQTAWLRGFLLRHQSSIEGSLVQIEKSASTAVAGLLIIPILAIFFLSDGESLARQMIRLFSTENNIVALQSLVEELHHTLQRYIRAKVSLAGLSFLFCSMAMLMLGFPNAIALGALAGILEFIPVAGWIMAAAISVSTGALAHAHWIWMLGLLGCWRVLMDYAISPRVMGRELEMHPLVAIFTVMVGGAIGGIIGIYLSIPLVAVLRVVYRRFGPHMTEALSDRKVS